MKLGNVVAIGLLILLSTSDIAQGYGRPGRLISLEGTDTIVADLDGEVVKIKLACITVPQSSAMVKSYIQQILPKDAKLIINGTDTNDDGKIAAEVYANGVLVNLEMVATGHARTNNLNTFPCVESKNAFQQAEQNAKAAGLGIWRFNGGY